jgi:ribosomal protein S18 acetylase RimI-like enzyme
MRVCLMTHRPLERSQRVRSRQQSRRHCSGHLESGRVIGFVTSLTDGVLSGFISLLEVLPPYQGQGIGQALMSRMLDRLGHLPNVDLLCDPNVAPFYEQFGMKPVVGMVLRPQKG